MGGGPSGAAAATHLAAAGVEVVVFERLRAPRWRASGVYSSPSTRARLAGLGLSEAALVRLIRPIDAMEVIGPGGTRCLLAYDAPDHACGIDRVRLERALLDRAAAAGACVREGAVVRTLAPREGRAPGSTLDVSTDDGPQRWNARMVVGADGPRSLVASAYGLGGHVRLSRRAGVTVHRADPDAASPGMPMTARMVIGDGWYCGICPVPEERVNVGIVMSEADLRARLRGGDGLAAVARSFTDHLHGPRAAWHDSTDTDAVTVALPLAHRVIRRSGRGFLLVGDASGFIDPLTGDGLLRALISAELAAHAIVAARAGRSDAMDHYERRMHARFAPRDIVSWLLQAFLARPGLLEYALRRLATRTQLRATFARALAELEPAGRILEPRFLVRLLAP